MSKLTKHIHVFDDGRVDYSETGPGIAVRSSEISFVNETRESSKSYRISDEQAEDIKKAKDGKNKDKLVNDIIKKEKE